MCLNGGTTTGLNNLREVFFEKSFVMGDTSMLGADFVNGIMRTTKSDYNLKTARDHETI